MKKITEYQRKVGQWRLAMKEERRNGRTLFRIHGHHPKIGEVSFGKFTKSRIALLKFNNMDPYTCLYKRMEDVFIDSGKEQNHAPI